MSVSYEQLFALPTLSASQTPGNIVATPNQQIQYFAQGQSNAPGQTVDFVLRNINAQLQLWTAVLQTPTFSTEVTAGTVPSLTQIQTTILILKNCSAAILRHFSEEPQWFSANSPYKGYASNNAINSIVSQLNINPVYSFTNPISATTLARIVFNKLSAQYNDFLHYTTQINRYSYRFMGVKSVVTSSTADYTGTYYTNKTVEEWFVVMWNFMSALPCFSEAGTTYGASSAGLYWDSTVSTPSGALGIDSVLGYFTTNSVYIESLIPEVYKVLPSGSISSLLTSTAQNDFLIFMFIVFTSLLLKQLQALHIGFLKIADLTTSAGDAIFASPSTDITLALQAYSTLYVNFIVSCATTTDSVTGRVQGCFINVNTFARANAVAALDSRNASVDPNRVPGSLIPTLNFQINLCNAITNIYNNTYFNTNIYQTLVPTCQTAMTALVGALPTVNSYLSTAITDLDSTSGDIHYGRWPFYMGTI
jgi:hypothetical protein